VFQSRISKRVGLATLLLVQLFPPALAQRATDAPAGSAAALHLPGTVCQTPAVEAALLQRESNVLGRAHAEEHARMRAQQCEAERGLRPVPAQGPAKSGPATLQEDAAVLEAADALAADINASSGSPNAARAAKAGSSQGRWSDPFLIPVVGITSVLLHTGKVLFWSYDPVNWDNPASSTSGVAYIWDPATRTGHSIAPPENLWCAGQTLLADGRVFIAGGNLRYPDPNAPAGYTGWEGTLTTYTFNPATESFVRQPNMLRGRWYPTTTRLADNRVVITSGYDETGTEAITNNVEIFTPSADPAGVGSIVLAGTHDPTGLYPLQYLLSGGSMLEAGPAPPSFLYDPAANRWIQLPAMLNPHWSYGNGIIYTDASGATPRQVVMVAGGLNISQSLTANEWLDGNYPAAGWQPFPQWLQRRHNANTVILPDGKLLTIGGNRGLNTYDDPLLQTELYSAEPTVTSGQWQAMAPHAIQAAYHSTAILLPDATVLLSQDDMDRSAAAAAQHKAQVYSPPYLFKGKRPNIKTAPTSVSRGQSFDVGTDRSVASAMLIAPGATTHSNDMHQRAIRLQVQPGSAGLTATIPNSPAIVPSGYYMLFVLDSTGVPSVARFVRVA
jgi:hypothetical protein